MTKIGANATSAKFSAEGQALEYEGTIYISDGADDVFALDAGSGESLWTYEPHLPPDPLGEVVCCGWDNRGVAIGDGMVFVSQLNGAQVALDQETGKVEMVDQRWSSRARASRSPARRSTTTARSTSAVPAASTAIRGRLTALNAETGKDEWRFWTTPSPMKPAATPGRDNGPTKPAAPRSGTRRR